MATARVFLVPGFFGFANLGDLTYWGHAHQALGQHARSLGEDTTVEVARTPPTASLRRRALALLRAIERSAGPEDPIYLIGHSSGGLDARLLASPGVQLEAGVDAEPIARRIRAVVTVATPHYGTPVAGTFSSLQGQLLLRVISAATIFILRRGALPLWAALQLGELFTRVETLTPEIVDQLFRELLGEFSPERRDQVTSFVAEVGDDQALLEQLRPEVMETFNAAVPDRDTVAYGSVITRARPPRLLTDGFRNALSPYGQASLAWYVACYHLAARIEPSRLPARTDVQQAMLDSLPEVATETDNDGMVPTLSQVHGQVIRAVQADHLDVIGHFDDPETSPPHIDWIRTGSGFRRPQFDALWTDVARFLTEAGRTVGTP